MHPLRSVFPVIALAALLVGCDSSGATGGSSSEPSGAASVEPSEAASTEPSQDPGLSPEPVPSDGGSGGSSEIPDIADGPWGAGTAQAKISGDVTAAIDASMVADLGYTQEGLTTFVFTDETSSVINITLSNQEATGSGVSSTSSNVSTAGTWGQGGCEIDVSKSDDSGIEATFACNDIDAIALTTATAYKVDLEGSFEVAR